MLKIKCSRCKEELSEPGGLCFSPPNYDMVGKFHLCVSCWMLWLDFLGLPR